MIADGFPDLATVAPLLEPEHTRIRRELLAWVEDHASLFAPVEDDAAGRVQARAILAALGEDGWTRFAVPAVDLGAAAQEAEDTRGICWVREGLAYASPLADAVLALQGLGAAPLRVAGSRELRERWLPGIRRGEVMAAFAMTEPEAGSDVSSMRTTVRKKDGGYLLNGHKWLISNAGLADLYIVFAADKPSDETGSLSCFAVPADTEGLQFRGAQEMSEPHPLGELEFQDCYLPAEALVGEEGEGLKIGLQALDRLRPTVAAAACGMAARALAEARAHVLQRRQFGRELSRFQLVQAKLAQAFADLCAARLLTYRAAWELDRDGDRVTLCSSVAKLQATELAQSIVDSAVQVLGGRGVLADHPVDRLYRSVRALRIYEGTSEIQLLVIAREFLA